MAHKRKRINTLTPPVFQEGIWEGISETFINWSAAKEKKMTKTWENKRQNNKHGFGRWFFYQADNT